MLYRVTVGVQFLGNAQAADICSDKVLEALIDLISPSIDSIGMLSVDSAGIATYNIVLDASGPVRSVAFVVAMIADAVDAVMENSGIDCVQGLHSISVQKEQ